MSKSTSSVLHNKPVTSGKIDNTIEELSVGSKFIINIQVGVDAALLCVRERSKHLCDSLLTFAENLFQCVNHHNEIHSDAWPNRSLKYLHNSKLIKSET